MSVDVSLMRQFSSETFAALLRQIPGDKDMIIAPDLMKPLDKIAGMTLLKTCGVKKVFKYPTDMSVAHNRIYMLHSSLEATKSVIDQLKSTSALGLNIYLVFVPKALQSIHIFLEQEGMTEKVHVREFAWQLLPLDSDLLSLELQESFFSTTFHKKDLSMLPVISNSLFKLFCLYGSAPNRIALGKKSSAILKQLEILESQIGAGDQKNEADIGHIILMDRDFDYPACLISPVTYEALLDEVYGINCGVVDISEAGQANTNTKLELSSKDRVFENIRHKNFSDIFAYLSSSAKQIQQSQSMASTMNVTEMKDFVQKNLKNLQQQSRAISFHISAGEKVQSEKGYFYENLIGLEGSLIHGGGLREVMTYLERAMSILQPIEVVLRLLCLASCCLGGLSQSDMARMKRLICEAYGHKHLSTLSTLSEMGLLRVKSAQSNEGIPNFSQLCQKLDLIPKTQDIRKDRDVDMDPSVAYSHFYVPVIHQVVRLLLNNPQGLTDLIKQNVLPSSLAYCQKPSKSRIVLIYFVGGYTMAEASALKSLQASSSYRFLIAGTGNTTGKSIMQTVLV